MPNVLITRQGLQFVLSAHDNGVYIDLKYFVPVYDDRIDSTLRSTGALSSIADVADEDATTPYGEIIWNTDGYTINETDYVISAGAATGGFINESYQKTIVKTNLLDGIPLSRQVSGTAFTVSGGSTVGYYDWTITGSGGVTGSNARPLSTTADYFSVQDYYPVYDTSAASRLRGAFKAVIARKMGKFKFNKLAMYANQVDTNGVTLGECFFGEAYLSEPVVKTELASDGFDNFIFDIQLDLSGTSATFDEVFFASSADNWNQSPGGLYTPQRIGVGQFIENVREISATAHLRKARGENGIVDLTLPVLRMDYDNARYVSFDVVSAGYLVSADDGGDLVVSVSNWSTYCGETIAIRPKVARIIALGTSTYPFRLAFLNNGTSHALDVNGSEIKVGLPEGYAQSKYYGIPGLQLANQSVELTYLSPSSQSYTAFIGGDLYRKYQEMFIFTTYYCNPSTSEENYVKDIAIVAGLDTSGTYAGGTPSGQINHTALITQLITNADFSSNLASSAAIHLAAKGGIKLHGVLEMKNNGNGYTAGSTSYTHNSSMVLARENDLLLIAGLKSDATYNQVNTLFNTINSDWSSVLCAKHVLLAGSSIKTKGSLIPWIHNTDDLGELNRAYRNLYVGTGYFTNAEITNSLTVEDLIINGNSINTWVDATDYFNDTTTDAIPTTTVYGPMTFDYIKYIIIGKTVILKMKILFTNIHALAGTSDNAITTYTLYTKKCPSALPITVYGTSNTPIYPIQKILMTNVSKWQWGSGEAWYGITSNNIKMSIRTMDNVPTGLGGQVISGQSMLFAFERTPFSVAAGTSLTALVHQIQQGFKTSEGGLTFTFEGQAIFELD